MRVAIFFSFFLFNSFYSQVSNFQWAKCFLTTSFDKGLSIAVDNSGNVITTGLLSGTADFDPGPSTFTLAGWQGGAFVSKLDANGQFQWACQFPGSTGKVVKTDNQNNVYVAGLFQMSGDFDPGPGVYNLTCAGQDIFIVKLSPSGNLIWAKNFTGNWSEDIFGMTLDSDKNLLTTGIFSTTTDFDPGPSVVSIPTPTIGCNIDIFVCKLDSNGNFGWVKHFGNNVAHELSSSISTDQNGNVYTVGSFSISCDFDPGAAVYPLTTNSVINSFITKLDASGNFLWAKQFTSSNNDENRALSVDVDASGNVYSTGYYAYSADFDPGPGTYTLSFNSWNCMFISKLNTNGDFVWAKSINGNSIDGMSIKVDNVGGVYTTGHFQSADFDPGVGTFNLGSVFSIPTTRDSFILKLDNNGGFVFAKSWGSDQNDRGHSIALSSTGDIYTTGYVCAGSPFVDADPGPNTYTLQVSNISIYVHKMGQCNAPTIPINNTPAANLNICSGNIATLSAIASGTVNWFTSSTGTTSIGSGSIFITSTLTNITTYYAEDLTSCAPSASRIAITVSINPTPSVSIISSNTLICIGQTATLNANGASTYTWNTSMTGSVISISPTVTTTYSVNGEDMNGCENSSSITVSVSACAGISTSATCDSEIWIYPNPSSGKIYVDQVKNNTFLSDLTLYNTLGEAVFFQKLVSNKETIETNLPQGVYFYSILKNGTISIKGKLIVQ